MKKGLNKTIDIIAKEMEYAKKANPVMAMGMLRIDELVRKELKRINRSKKISSYFTVSKGLDEGDVLITIIKTDSKYSDLELEGSVIRVSLGIELYLTDKGIESLDMRYPGITKYDKRILYTDIATTLWEEYGNLVLKNI